MNLMLVINEEAKHDGKQYKIWLGFMFNENAKLTVKKGQFIGREIKHER